MKPQTGITGIILSGGKGTRLGEEKGLAVFHGRPLISHAVGILEDLCDEIMISANDQLEEYAKFGYEIVTDRHTGIGPMGGLSACLERSSTRLNFILSCDTPFVPADLYRYLLQKLDNQQAAIPVQNGLPEPLCGIYATNTVWYINDLIGQQRYKMTDLLETLNCLYAEVDERLPFYNGEIFMNINTKKDLDSGVENKSNDGKGK